MGMKTLFFNIAVEILFVDSLKDDHRPPLLLQQRDSDRGTVYRTGILLTPNK